MIFLYIWRKRFRIQGNVWYHGNKFTFIFNFIPVLELEFSSFIILIKSFAHRGKGLLNERDIYSNETSFIADF